MNSLAHITAEQAKELKEQGFNWPVTQYIIIGDSMFIDKEQTGEIDNYNRSNTLASIPTLALACQWLREEKGLHVYVDYGLNGLWYYMIRPRAGILTGCDLIHPDHDTALIAGIDKALTILKERP